MKCFPNQRDWLTQAKNIDGVSNMTCELNKKHIPNICMIYVTVCNKETWQFPLMLLKNISGNKSLTQ